MLSFGIVNICAGYLAGGDDARVLIKPFHAELLKASGVNAWAWWKLLTSAFAWRQFSLLVVIGRRHVHAHRLQERTTGVADFMFVPGLDQQHDTSVQFELAAINHRDACAIDDEQPLVRPAMKVVGPALLAANGQHHDRTLRLGIARR